MKRNNLICVKQILWYIRFIASGKRDMTWRMFTTATAAKMRIGAASCSVHDFLWTRQLHPLPEPEQPRVHSRPQPELRGKNVFEAKCATCHGLDGLGGEHAPDIVRRLAMRTISDQTLLDVIHEGIPEAGMPELPNLGREDDRALVAYIRFLQGKSAGDSAPGDPSGQGIFSSARPAAPHVTAGGQVIRRRRPRRVCDGIIGKARFVKRFSVRAETGRRRRPLWHGMVASSPA